MGITIVCSKEKIYVLMALFYDLALVFKIVISNNTVRCSVIKFSYALSRTVTAITMIILFSSGNLPGHGCDGMLYALPPPPLG